MKTSTISQSCGSSRCKIRESYLRKLGFVLGKNQNSVEKLKTSSSSYPYCGTMDMDHEVDDQTTQTPRNTNKMNVSTWTDPHITPKSCFNKPFLLLLLVILALVVSPSQGQELVDCNDRQAMDRPCVADNVRYFEIPRTIQAEITYELLTRRVPNYHQANEEELSVFMEFARSLVESKLAGAGEHELLRALYDLKDSVAVVVSGAPQDPYKPRTPTDGRRSLGKKTQFAEVMSAGLASVAGGKMIAYPWEMEYSNTCFHEGFARPHGSAVSSDKSVSPHLEMSYLPDHFIPDILVLAAVREGHDKKVETVLIENARILSMVPSTYIQILRENRFVFERPTWVDSKADRFFQEPIPIVSGTSDDPMIRLPASGPHKVHPADPNDSAAEIALRALYKAVEDVQVQTKVHLRNGDILLFNNKHVLHSRNAYAKPQYDGHDRVLIRSYYILSGWEDVDWENACFYPGGMAT